MPRRNSNAPKNGQRTPSHQKGQKKGKRAKKAATTRAKKRARRSGEAEQPSSSKNTTRKRRPAGARGRRKDRHESDKRHIQGKSGPLVGKILEGKLELHPDGFGFLIADSSELPNIYMGKEELKDVLHRDRLRVEVTSHYKSGNEDRYKGKLVEITQRAADEFLGNLRLFRGGAMVIPLEARNRHMSFRVEEDEVIGTEFKNGIGVVAKITQYPSKGIGKARLIESIENMNDPGSDTLRVLVEANWPREFSNQCIRDAEEAATDWQSKLGSHVEDLRSLPFVTIDGADARDFDDAVCAKKLSGGEIEVHVAIADVSHFVKRGTQLDDEARGKATSAYFPDLVVPMLPEVLSNGVCSLNPNEDRLGLVCRFHIDKKGKLKDQSFCEALIVSKKRMTYELMEAYMEREDYAVQECKDLKENLDCLVEAYQRLFKAKQNRGALDLDIPEARIILNKDGTVKDIQTRTRLDAHRLIEDLMLAANHCTAKFLHAQKDRGGMYRVHEQPDPKKTEILSNFLELSAMECPKQLESASDFSELIESLREKISEGDPKAMAVQNLVLRSMQQARYCPEPLGHFALADSDYTHFTSPIRRYPDLVVHRLLKEHLGIEKGQAPLDADLDGIALHCSEQERTAMDMERRLIDLKKCRFLEPHLGEEFRATVTGVIEKGIFCQIEDHFVDGLIKADRLYNFGRYLWDEATMAYRSKQGLAPITLGTRLLIQVAAVDVVAAKSEFEIIKLI